METTNKFKPTQILIGFKRYSTLEFEKYGFRILFDFEYANKLKNYIEEWGLDEESVFENLVNDCCALIKGKYNKRNDLPTRFSESSRYGTTTNLLNGIKIQFIEDTLFGKEYKSEIHNINVEEEQMIHFFY
jgi:hypothetical protein